MSQEMNNCKYQHELGAICFKNCTNWNLSIKNKKSNTNIILSGKGLFLKQLQSQILTNFELIDKISEISSSTLKLLNDKIFLEENKLSTEEKEKIEFPIDNSNFSVEGDKPNKSIFIFDNNKQNKLISNTIYLDFDISSIDSVVSGIEHQNSFTNIDGNFVNNDLEFNINGIIHSNQTTCNKHSGKVFKKDFTIELQTKKIIKSIQSRIENHKITFMEKQNLIQFNNPNIRIKNSKNTFFTIIDQEVTDSDNINFNNIGVEFYLPEKFNIETYKTNFQGAVKSDIKIKKIYFEFDISNFIFKNKLEHEREKTEIEEKISKDGQSKMGSRSYTSSNLHSFSNMAPFKIENTKPFFYVNKSNRCSGDDYGDNSNKISSNSNSQTPTFNKHKKFETKKLSNRNSSNKNLNGYYNCYNTYETREQSQQESKNYNYSRDSNHPFSDKHKAPSQNASNNCYNTNQNMVHPDDDNNLSYTNTSTNYNQNNNNNDSKSDKNLPKQSPNFNASEYSSVYNTVYNTYAYNNKNNSNINKDRDNVNASNNSNNSSKRSFLSENSIYDTNKESKGGKGGKRGKGGKENNGNIVQSNTSNQYNKDYNKTNKEANDGINTKSQSNKNLPNKSSSKNLPDYNQQNQTKASKNKKKNKNDYDNNYNEYTQYNTYDESKSYESYGDTNLNFKDKNYNHNYDKNNNYYENNYNNYNSYNNYNNYNSNSNNYNNQYVYNTNSITPKSTTSSTKVSPNFDKANTKKADNNLTREFSGTSINELEKTSDRSRDLSLKSTTVDEEYKEDEFFDSIKANKQNFTNIFLTHYDGLCNFILFSQAITTYISSNSINSIKKISLNEYFKIFEKLSIFGLDISFIHEDEIISVNYTPTLSSFDILITEGETCYLIEEELRNLMKTENSNKFKHYENHFEKQYKLLNEIHSDTSPSAKNTDTTVTDNDTDTSTLQIEYRVTDSFSIIAHDSKIRFKYDEYRPVHNRNTLLEQIDQLLSKFAILKNIKIDDIDNRAWWAINWTPFKSPKPQFMNSSFIVYYQFKYSQCEEYYSKFTSKYLEIPTVGILPLKLDKGVWFNRIVKGGRVRGNSSNNFGSMNSVHSINSNDSNRDYNNLNMNKDCRDLILYKDKSIANVYSFVYSKSDECSVSYDYDMFIKSSNNKNDIVYA